MRSWTKIPAAYEAVEQVMRDAADLVEEVRHELRQIVNVKGD